MGWPLRPAARFREFGGSFVYPMGEDMVTIGMVVGLDYRDASLSVHDLLQELKTHPRIRPILEGGERIAWGAKTIPEGGFVALPRRLHAPGLLVVGDGGRARERAGAEGDPLRGRVGPARGGGGVAVARPAVSSALRYDAALRSSFVWRDLRTVRNMRQAFGAGFWRGSALAGLATVTGGQASRRATGRPSATPTTRSSSRRPRRRRTRRRTATLTFDKLSSVFLSGNRTRDDQPSHIRVATRVPAELGRALGEDVPGAGLRGRRRRRGRPGRGRGDARRTASSAARSPPRAAA